MGRRIGAPLKRLSGFRGIGGGGAAALVPPSSNLIDWYRPSGVSLADPASWLDEGSLARTITKTTNNPVAGISIDGNATVDFSGGAAVLKNTSGSRSQPFTKYLVVRTRTVASTQLITDGHTATNRATTQVIATGVFRANAGSNLSSAANALVNDTVYLLRATFETTSSLLYVTNLDGSPVAGPATVGTGTWDGITIGGSNAGASSFPGDIAEVLVYTGTHDATAVEAYLLAKYPSASKATWTPWDMMMTGDSLCVGQGSTDGRGSRSILRLAFEPLASDIEQGVRRLRFEGLVADRCMSHSGVSGRPIPTLRDNIAAQLASLPDLCMILIGTNDCRNNGTTYDGTLTPAAYADMLTNAFAASASTKFRCFTVPPLINGTHNANVADLNGKLPAIIATAAGGGMDVSLHDLNAVINSGTMLDGDGVHLNDLGYAAKATLEQSVIRAAA